MTNMTFDRVVTYDPVQAFPNATAITLLNTSVGKTEKKTYYWAAEDLARFQKWYEPAHVYLASSMCILGIIANGLNIIVLTRKNMISATNSILTAIAVADGLTMMVYLPFAIVYYSLMDLTSQRIAEFLLFFVCFSVLAHSISIWLTVLLAVFRFLFIKYPRRGQDLCSIERAKLAIIIVFFALVFVCIPNMIAHNIREEFDNVTNTTMYTMSSRHSPGFYEVINRINFWIVSVFIKLLPCFLLIILSILLIKCMREADERRKNLRKQTKPNCKESDSSRDRKTNRTTRMLLTVVILFVICELPQGIVGLLVGTLGEQFSMEIYSPLGEVFDIIALLNNGINFILYCTMSKQFRDTFTLVFFKPILGSGRGRFSLVPNHKNSENTKSTDV